eukprot:TRINITY_DN9474_c1_g1_i1.p1 TRINITY_DN9474_c1_g1~~TRINITY_DN9474_c1_g1_i1.p1  ORF type:complete len:147 (+),score=23.60 TRINITY_DN9474_c1_g1_i1:46-486(+)
MSSRVGKLYTVMRNREREVWEIQIEPDPDGGGNWRVWKQEDQSLRYLHSWHWSGVCGEISPAWRPRAHYQKEASSAVPMAIKKAATRNAPPRPQSPYKKDAFRSPPTSHIEVLLDPVSKKKKKKSTKKQTPKRVSHHLPTHKPSFR